MVTGDDAGKILVSRIVKTLVLFTIIMVLGVKIALFLHIHADFAYFGRISYIFSGANIAFCAVLYSVSDPQKMRKIPILRGDSPPISPLFSITFLT